MSEALKRNEELERVTTRFNVISVRRVGARVDLDVEGATFATWHPQHLLTGYSWDALTFGCLLRGGGPPERILVLGLGGGTVTRQLRHFLPRAQLVGVEIDAGVIDLARRYAHLDEQGVETHVVDAYDFLAQSTGQFDAIIDDLFLTGPTDVARSRTPEGSTLELLRSRLAPGGILVANFITDTGEHRVVRTAGRKAFLGAFAETRVVTPPRGLNEILVGGEHTLPRSALDRFGQSLTSPHDKQRLVEVRVAPLRAS